MKVGNSELKDSGSPVLDERGTVVGTFIGNYMPKDQRTVETKDQ
jgi:hypothetical protein